MFKAIRRGLIVLATVAAVGGAATTPAFADEREAGEAIKAEEELAKEQEKAAEELAKEQEKAAEEQAKAAEEAAKEVEDASAP